MKEFDFINSLRSNLIEDRSILGIGDDAACIGELLFAKDIIVSDVHFKMDAPVENILFKLITSNVSDISAMGGESVYALLGIAAEKGFTDSSNIINGLIKGLNRYNIKLIGGDTTSSEKGLFLSMTVIGKRGRYLLKRSGAGNGDILFISRPVGLSKVSLEVELGIKAYDIDRYVHYNQIAETELGKFLSSKDYVTSCIDISDGIGRDLSHISDSSNVKIVLEKRKLPLSHIAEYGITNSIDYFLSSGEEYALAFTIKKDSLHTFINEISHNNLSPIEIGYVVEGNGVFLEDNSTMVDISNSGYQHSV